MLVRRLALPIAVAAAVLGLTAAPAHAADTTPPTAPGAIQIAEITETTVRLTWAPSTDDVGVVSYAVSQTYTDVVFQRSATTNEIAFSGLRPSGTYSYYVRALDAAGNSSPSVFLRITQPPGDSQPPTAPGQPVATTVGDTWIQLNWAPSTDNVYVANYLVLRITAEGSTVVGFAPQHPPTGPQTRLFNLTPNTTYTFAVRARDDAGNESALSPTLTVTTRPVDGAPPTAPGTPVASEVTSTSVLLTWAPATDDVAVARYVVVNLDAAGGPAEVASTSNTTIRLGVLPNTRYTFVVHAVDGVGNRSLASGQVSVHTPEQVNCVVSYRIVSQWRGGFQADVTLRNPGPSTYDGWTMEWTFPTGQSITSIWGAVGVDPTGPAVTVRNQSWNGRVAPGAAVWFGFIGSWSVENQVPYGFVVNGVPCQVTPPA
jgi:chitodextrinase